MKYIMDIEEKPLCVFDKDTQTYFPRLWRVKGFNSLVFDEEGLSRLEELNSDYINEHYGDMQDTAYKKGFEDGKAVSDKGCVGCQWEGNGKDHSPCDYCCNCYSSQWTAKQTDDEIKVGDEVEISQSDENGVWVVIKVEKHDGRETYCAINKDGDIYFEEEQDKVTKTGRHFDISSILKEMQS